jgi:ribosomal protein S21
MSQRRRRKAKPMNLEIVIRNPDETERMIKKFIRKSKKMGIIEECRNRRYYTKPSVKKRLKRIEAERRRRKNK